MSQSIKTYTIFPSIALLLLCVLFLSHADFVESDVVPKWYGFIAGTVLLVCSLLFCRRRIEFLFDYTSLAVSLFLGYLLLRMSLAGVSAITVLSITSFILLYFLFKVIGDDQTRYIGITVICLCTIQALYGIGQWCGVFHAGPGFKMTGSFDNPAGLAACLAAGFPFSFSLLGKSRPLKYGGCIGVGTVVIAVLLSGSRAGIIAIILVSAVWSTDKYRKTIRKHLGYIVVLALLFLLFAVGLIFLKKDSARGRMLIWRNSLEMIAHKPIFGHDPGVFSSHYMLYQADYFAENPDSKYAQLADNVTHPFNEYLLLGIEYGIVGLVLLLGVIIALWKSERKQISIPILCLMSVAVFSCFSYPLRYPFVWVILAYSLADLSKRSQLKHSKVVLHPLFIRSFLGLAAIMITVFLIKDIKFEYGWGRLTHRAGFGKSEKLIEDYYNFYAQWNGDPLFLYNYGAVLNRAGQYAKSNLVMSECENYLNDYDVQLIMGDNNFQIGEWAAAEHHYALAGKMIPSRFMPLYSLMELYLATGDRCQALNMAEKIMAKEIKVPSSTIYDIIRKAERLIAETNEVGKTSALSPVPDLFPTRVFVQH